MLRALSWRYVHAIGKESFNSGVIALDRRDISVGAMPNDIVDSPFNIDPPGTFGMGWENNVRSNTGDAGAFADLRHRLGRQSRSHPGRAL